MNVPQFPPIFDHVSVDDVKAIYTQPMTVDITTRAVQEAGDSTQEAEGRLWPGGASAEEIHRQSVIGDRMAVDLYQTVHKHERWPEWKQWGEQQLVLIVSRARLSPPLNVLIKLDSEDPDVQARVFNGFRAVTMATFNLGEYHLIDGKLHSASASAIIRRSYADWFDGWRAAVRGMLAAVGIPPDNWHQHALFAYLIVPPMARYLLVLPYWLVETETGGGPLLQTADTPIGAPELTERVAVRMKRAWQREGGFSRRRKPGPRAGAQYRKSPERSAFEQYVRARAQRGISAQFIEADAEARRLHRISRGRHDVELTEQLVRAILRDRQKT